MINKIKYIIKVFFMALLIMCWVMSIGYANRIKPKHKTANFYLLDEATHTSKISEFKKGNKDLDIVGWREDDFQEINNSDLNRKVDKVKVLSVKGNLSLILKSANLLKDDFKGCLIDEDTAYKLFGGVTNIIGSKLEYKGEQFVVRGIHNDEDSNLIVNIKNDKDVSLNGMTLNSEKFTSTKLENFKSQNGIKAVIVDGALYYNFAKYISLLFPLIIAVIIIFKILKRAYIVRRKPVQLGIYLILSICTLLLFMKITNFRIKIPLDMIPNKWSDFEFWDKLWKESTQKYEYVLYMKKYGLDIYNIKNLISSIKYSLICVFLFLISRKFIKFKSFKGVISHMIIMLIVIFTIVISISNSMYNFNVNLPMVWFIYPAYIFVEFYLMKKDLLESIKE
ncbi:ABC transporter permease [Clostridium oceanicum]|uniref:MacB-like periplasmic core domain-containing protein n=1 Tax=Clostridium oceanicum TaxID=1543 RepID=A0ABN1JFQ9_9CLOT